MNRPTSGLLVLACLGIMLVVSVGCVPPPILVPAAVSPPTAAPAAATTAAPAAATTAAPATATPANAITNIVWKWTSVTNKPANETTTVPDPQNYTITFRDDGTLSGKADCNSFTGTYSQQSGFSITIGAVTRAACGENSLDQQYLELLGAVAAGGPDGAGNLALETAGGEQRMLFANGGAAKAP
jgi:heat shock protein HslJ